jgi:hypothetical protein
MRAAGGGSQFKNKKHEGITKNYLFEVPLIKGIEKHTDIIKSIFIDFDIHLKKCSISLLIQPEID